MQSSCQCVVNIILQYLITHKYFTSFLHVGPDGSIRHESMSACKVAFKQFESGGDSSDKGSSGNDRGKGCSDSSCGSGDGCNWYRDNGGDNEDGKAAIATAIKAAITAAVMAATAVAITEALATQEATELSSSAEMLRRQF